MAAGEGQKRKRPAEKPESQVAPARESKLAIEKARAEADAALTRAKEEERARLKAEEALARAQGALAGARAKLEQERLSRAEAEHARAEAETTLAEARKAIGAKTENTTPPRKPRGEEEGEQRISFIVRLTIDERGQPRRTEVEHAQSGKKETFPALDVQRLGAFMEMCISPPLIPEPATPPVPSLLTKEALTPGPLGPASGLTVSDVQVFRTGALRVGALVLSPDEAFVVRARFRLHGREAPSLTAQESSFVMKVSAYEVTSGTSTLLITCRENLVNDILEYTPQALAPGLPPGLYRLGTLVTLQAPTRMVGYHDGPIVHVFGTQPSANPPIPLEVPLSQVKQME